VRDSGVAGAGPGVGDALRSTGVGAGSAGVRETVRGGGGAGASAVTGVLETDRVD